MLNSCLHSLHLYLCSMLCQQSPEAGAARLHTLSIPLASCLASAAGNLAAMQAMILSSWGPWVS